MQAKLNELPTRFKETTFHPITPNILSKAGEGQAEGVFPARPKVPDRQADPSGLLLCWNLFNFEPGVGLEHGYPGHENHPGWSRPGRPKEATRGRIAEGARHKVLVLTEY